MSLEVGSRLGHYDVTALIGEGGMGQVYQATDTKLNRQVALKILPEAFAADPDRLERFQREAQVLASLNHPNIAAIHGLEDSEGTKALVLELVEGPTLADRIAKGPVPIDEALPIARQIAEALEAAHEAGVIHRDLKPANIKVRGDGTVKVLDFGLAKALDTAPEGDPSLSPTLTAAATQMGVIMGTAAYMSPEQARGSVVDSRADVWSFGVVLYEMVTGTRLFDGATVSDTLASVLKTEPEWQLLPGDIPGSIKRVLRRCLNRDRKNRLQHIGDARVEISEALTAPPTEGPTVVTVGQPAGWRKALPWVAGLALATITGLAVWTFMQPPAALTTRFTIEPPPGVLLGTFLRISPDGRTVAFHGTSGNASQVYLRSLDQLEAFPLRGTEGTLPTRFSPDGQSLLVVDALDNGLPRSVGSVKRVPLAGGPPTTVAQGGAFTDLGSDGTIVLGGASGLRLIGPSGEETPLTTLGGGEAAHLQPRLLPSGRAVLFVVVTGGAATQVAVHDLETSERTDLLTGSTPSFTATGHLVFWRDSSLWAVPFDPDRLTVSGAEVAVVEEVASNGFLAKYALSDTGTLTYSPGSVEQRTLVWLDSAGGVVPVPGMEPDLYHSVRVSPDGRHLAFALEEGVSGADIWTVDLERGTTNPVTTTENAEERNPLWTPNGEYLLFQSNRSGRAEIWRKRADGTGEAELLLNRGDNLPGLEPSSWSLDGKKLFFQEVRPGGDDGFDSDIGVLDLETNEVAILVDDDAITGWPALSPDGQWLAYSSTFADSEEVYALRYPELTDRRIISTGGGHIPVWSTDGTELFYLGAGGQRVLSVPSPTEQTVSFGRPTVVSEDQFLVPVGGHRSLHVAPDGERLVAIVLGDVGEASGDAVLPSIIVVENWFEELKRLVPIP